MEDVVHICMVLLGIGHVQDETNIETLDVILPSENSRYMESAKRADAGELMYLCSHSMECISEFIIPCMVIGSAGSQIK